LIDEEEMMLIKVVVGGSSDINTNLKVVRLLEIFLL
jgi:hypothetical protein